MSHYPTLFNGYNYNINSGGIICNSFIKDPSKIINCFIPISSVNDYQKLLALGINPNTCELSNNGILQKKEITFISSSVGSDRTKVLVCFLNLREKYMLFLWYK